MIRVFCFQYLERRFGYAAKFLGAVLFIIKQVILIDKKLSLMVHFKMMQCAICLDVVYSYCHLCASACF